ncbi:MAG: c-type cytochrome [Ginsengibacter sp.]
MNKLVVLAFLTLPSFLLLKNQSAEIEKTPVASMQPSLKNGEAIFKKYCISCHQADGGGVPHMTPSLIKSKYAMAEKDSVIKILLNGLQGREINGQTYNNPMPPLGAVLKDKEIADVLTYVRNSFGNKAPAITASDVKKARSNANTASN